MKGRDRALRAGYAAPVPVCFAATPHRLPRISHHSHGRKPWDHPPTIGHPAESSFERGSCSKPPTPPMSLRAKAETLTMTYKSLHDQTSPPIYPPPPLLRTSHTGLLAHHTQRFRHLLFHSLCLEHPSCHPQGSCHHLPMKSSPKTLLKISTAAHCPHSSCPPDSTPSHHSLGAI